MIHNVCGHPLDRHHRDPRSLGCPPDQYRFTFQVGDEQIHETKACSIPLARLIAQSLARSEQTTIRIFKHERVRYPWEKTA